MQKQILRFAQDDPFWVDSGHLEDFLTTRLFTYAPILFYS